MNKVIIEKLQMKHEIPGKTFLANYNAKSEVT